MKTKHTKILAAGFILYLSVQAVTAIANTVSAVFAYVQYTWAAGHAPEMYDANILQKMVFSIVTFILSSLACTLLAGIASSSLIEKCGALKEKLQKVWFVPGILFVLQSAVYAVSEIVSAFAQPEEFLPQYLLSAVTGLIAPLLLRAVSAVLYFSLPRVLLENDLFVFKKEKAETEAGEFSENCEQVL